MFTQLTLSAMKNSIKEKKKNNLRSRRKLDTGVVCDFITPPQETLRPKFFSFRKSTMEKKILPRIHNSLPASFTTPEAFRSYQSTSLK